jgi:hypothetical protein
VPHGLLAKYKRSGIYDWPIIIAEHDWLDLKGFEEAFKKAIEIHRLKADNKILEVSFGRARGLRRRGNILRMLKSGIAAPSRTTRGFVIPFGWHR